MATSTRQPTDLFLRPSADPHFVPSDGFTGIGREFESIIIGESLTFFALQRILLGLLGFLAGGLVMFCGCFVVTRIWICYKVRKLQNRRFHDDTYADFEEGVSCGDAVHAKCVDCRLMKSATLTQ